MKTKTKSKLFAILLSLAMIFAMMPSPTYAGATYGFVTYISGSGSGNVSVYKEESGGWTLVNERELVEVDARLKIKATPDKYSDIVNNSVCISLFEESSAPVFFAGYKTSDTPLYFAEDENREIIEGEFIYDPSRLSQEYDSWKNSDKVKVIDIVFKNIITDTNSIQIRQTGRGNLSLYLKDGWKMTPAKRAKGGDTILVSAEAESGWTLSGLYLLEKDAAAPSGPYEITRDFSVFAYNDDMYQVTMPDYNAEVYAVFTSGDTPVEKHTVTVSGIKVEDKTYDGKTDATLDCSKAVVAGLQDGDSVTVSAKGAFADSFAGDNKKVEIKEITLQGDEQEKYEIDLANSQKEARGNIKKADPAVTDVSVTAPAAVYDTTAIEDIVLGFTADPDGGSIKLDDGQTLTVGTKDYNWTYTPAAKDIANYNNATGRVSITVEKAEQTVYNISYKLNGGSNPSDNPDTYTADTDTIILEDAFHSVMTFDGWYDAAGNRVTTIASGTTGNLSLEAKWSADITGTAFGVNLSETSYSYNGASQLPAVTVAGPAGNLTEGTDYTVTPPSDTKTTGEKTIAIRGTNTYNAGGTRYTGTRIATYQIVEGNQTIQIDTGNLTDLRYIGTPFTIMLALSQSGAGSGNVNWTSNDSSVISINGTDATILNTGTVTLTAKKEGDENYKEATDHVTVTIRKGKAPTIVFPTASDITYGQKLADSTFTGGSTEYGTFAWDNPSYVPDAGTAGYGVTFTPSAETEQNYEPIPDANKKQNVSVTVAKAKPTLTLTAKKEGNTAILTATVTSAGQGYGPIGSVGFKYSADNGSTWAMVPSGDSVMLAPGTGTATLVWDIPDANTVYQLRAFYSGDSNHNQADGSASFDPRKQDQTGFEVKASATQVAYGDGLMFTVLNGEGTGVVTYGVSDPSVMAVDGNGKAVILKAGTVNVTATKAGDNNYNPATATIPITIKKATLRFTAEDKTVNQGDPMPALTFKTTGLANGDALSVEPVLTTSAANTNEAGDFPITISGGIVVTKGGAVWTDCYEAVYEKGLLTVNAYYTVSVTNDGNGSGTATPMFGTQGTQVTLTASPNTGYKFKEWQVISGGVTITNDTFTIGTSDVKIKSTFDVVPYNISYHNLNGASNSNPTTYTIADTPITLVPPTDVAGYTFDGWYDNDSFNGSPVAGIPTDSTGDKTFYGKWTEITVTGIEIDSDSAKKIYTEGDTLDVTGLTLEVSKSDGSKETVDVTAFMVTGFDSSKTGRQTMTVTYEGFTATYEIEVKAKPNPPQPTAISYTAKDGSGNTIQSVTWQKGSGKDLDLTFKRSEEDHLTYGLFGSLEIGGVTVGSGNYGAAEGSLKLSIKRDYLETLSVGGHDVKVKFRDGDALIKLEVKEAANEPAPKPENEQAPKPEKESAPKPENEQAPKPEKESAPKPENEQAPKPEKESAPKPEKESAPKPEKKPASPNTGDGSSAAMYLSILILAASAIITLRIGARAFSHRRR